MNQNILGLLGCSAALAFVLPIENAVNAQPSSFQTQLSAMPTSSVTQRTEPLGGREVIFEAPQADPQAISIDPNSDTVGDLAIAKFKCDCMGCRNAVTQMIQSGRLSL